MKATGGAWIPRARDTFQLSELGFLTSTGDSDSALQHQDLSLAESGASSVPTHANVETMGALKMQLQ